MAPSPESIIRFIILRGVRGAICSAYPENLAFGWEDGDKERFVGCFRHSVQPGWLVASVWLGPRGIPSRYSVFGEFCKISILQIPMFEKITPPNSCYLQSAVACVSTLERQCGCQALPTPQPMHRRVGD
jgi:hypothetical protein